MLAALVKVDLRCRFARGQKPEVVEYLERFPTLQEQSDRVISLVYEEFCLCEEAGAGADPEEFCQRYDPWRDSLASQLAYHRLLSNVAGRSSTPPKFPDPGEYFERFRLREILGQGGAGRVYLADDEGLGGRLSALKISPDRGDEPAIMGRLDHPHIMPVLSVTRDETTGLRGLCMPYRPGRPLDDLLRRMDPTPVWKRTAKSFWDAICEGQPGPRTPGPGWEGFPFHGSYNDAVAWLGAALAEAVGHAHREKILHRDIKPANVLVTFDNGPQLLDFNLAHSPLLPNDDDAELRGGTLPYMSPEQLAAFLNPDRWPEVGAEADLYSLGLVLRELLTGHRPWSPEGDHSLPSVIQEFHDDRSQPPTPIVQENPSISPGLEAIVQKCLAPQPSDRYSDAESLKDDLRRFLNRKPTRQVWNPSRTERASHWLTRHRMAVVLVVLLAAAAVPAVTAVRRGLASWRHGDASALLASGRVDEAEKALRDALWLQPEFGAARTLLGVAGQRHWELALASVSSSPPNFDAFEHHRRQAVECGFQPSASSAEALVKLANDYIQADDRAVPAEAVRLLEAVRELCPQSYGAAHAWGVLHFRMANLPARPTPDEDSAAHAKRFNEMARDDMELAWQLVSNATNVSAQSRAEILRQKAAANIRLGHYDRAMADLERGRQIGLAKGAISDPSARDQFEHRLEYTRAKGLIGLSNDIAKRRDVPNQEDLLEIDRLRMEAVGCLRTAETLTPRHAPRQEIEKLLAALRKALLSQSAAPSLSAIGRTR